MFQLLLVASLFIISTAKLAVKFQFWVEKKVKKSYKKWNWESSFNFGYW